MIVKVYFDASEIELKKANEKRELIYELKEISQDGTINFKVIYSEKGRKTKIDDILKQTKKAKFIFGTKTQNLQEIIETLKQA